MEFRRYISVAVVLVGVLLAGVVVAAPPAGEPVTLPSVHVTVGASGFDTGSLTWRDDYGGWFDPTESSSVLVSDTGAGFAFYFQDPAGATYATGTFAASSLSGSWGTPVYAGAADADGNALTDLSGVGVSGGNFPQAVPEAASASLILPLSGLLLRRRSTRISTASSRRLSASSGYSSASQF